MLLAGRGSIIERLSVPLPFFLACIRSLLWVSFPAPGSLGRRSHAHSQPIDSRLHSLFTSFFSSFLSCSVRHLVSGAPRPSGHQLCNIEALVGGDLTPIDRRRNPRERPIIYRDGGHHQRRARHPRPAHDDLYSTCGMFDGCWLVRNLQRCLVRPELCTDWRSRRDSLLAGNDTGRPATQPDTERMGVLLPRCSVSDGLHICMFGDSGWLNGVVHTVPDGTW